MSTALRFDRVSLRYGGRVAVSDVSMTIERGEVICLLGPSGCGKSSLVRLALGLVAPSAGRVLVNEREASAHGRILVPPERRELAVVFQDLGLWPHLSAEAHLRFVLSARRTEKSARTSLVEAMLASVGLLDRRRAYPAELSGGERQRLAIARALVARPDVVLLDEPLSNLDVTLRRQLLRMFRELLAEQQASAVYVTHDIREAAFLGNKLAVMDQGKLVSLDTLDRLLGSEVKVVRQLLEGLALPVAR